MSVEEDLRDALWSLHLMGEETEALGSRRDRLKQWVRSESWSPCSLEVAGVLAASASPESSSYPHGEGQPFSRPSEKLWAGHIPLYGKTVANFTLCICNSNVTGLQMQIVSAQGCLADSILPL